VRRIYWDAVSASPGLTQSGIAVSIFCISLACAAKVLSVVSMAIKVSLMFTKLCNCRKYFTGSEDKEINR
jgi:hypothetical protein